MSSQNSEVSSELEAEIVAAMSGLEDTSNHDKKNTSPKEPLSEPLEASTPSDVQTQWKDVNDTILDELQDEPLNEVEVGEHVAEPNLQDPVAVQDGLPLKSVDTDDKNL